MYNPSLKPILRPISTIIKTIVIAITKWLICIRFLKYNVNEFDIVYIKYESNDRIIKNIVFKFMANKIKVGIFYNEVSKIFKGQKVQQIFIHQFQKPPQITNFITPKKLIFLNMILSIISISTPFVLRSLFQKMQKQSIVVEIIIISCLGFFNVIFDSLYNWQSNQFEYGLRIELSKILLKKELRSKNQQSIQVWNHIINDGHQFTHYYKTICLIYGDSLKLIFAIGYLYYKLGYVVIFGILLAILLIYLNSKIANKGQLVYEARMKNYVKKLNQVKYFIGNLTEIKMCRLEKFFYDKLLKLREQQLVTIKEKYFFDYLFIFLQQIILVIIATGFYLIYIYFYMSKEQEASQSQFNLIIVTYLIQLIRGPLSSIPAIFLGFKISKYSHSKLKKFLSQQNQQYQEKIKSTPEQSQNSIQINEGQVYGIQNFTLKILPMKLKKGKIYTIIGDSGSGKTLFIKSLFNLVSHNYELKISQSFGYVQDKPFHLKNSLNAIYNDPQQHLIPDPKLIKLLHKFHALQIPLKNDTSTYSGGQRLRLALTRAFFHSNIIVIDCSLNCLDNKVKQYIINSILQNQQSNTILLINDIPLSQNIIEIKDHRVELKNYQIPQKKVDQQMQIYKQKYYLQNVQDKKVENFFQSNYSKRQPIIIPSLQLNTYKLYYRHYFLHIVFILSIIVLESIDYYYTIYTSQKLKNQNAAQVIILLTVSFLIIWIFRTFSFVYSNYVQLKRLCQTIIKTLTLSKINFYQSKSTEQIIGRYTADSNLIDYAYPVVVNSIISGVISFIFMLIMIVSKLSSVMIIPISITLGYIYKIQKYYRKINNTLQSLQKDYSNQFYDLIEAVVKSKSLTLVQKNQTNYMKQLQQRLHHYMNILIGMKVIDRWIISRLQLASHLLFIFLLLLISFTDIKKYVQVSSLNLGIRYIVNITIVVGNLTFVYSKVQRISISLKRLEQYITPNKEIDNFLRECQKRFSKKQITQETIKPQIDIKNLKFQYNQRDREIFDGLNLKVNSNNRIMIRGKTGTGKTTLFKLLTGLYPEKFNFNSDLISFSPQKPLIISQNLQQNLDPYRICPKQTLQQILSKFPKGIPTSQLPYNDQMKLNGTRAQIYGENKIILYDQPNEVSDNRGCLIVSHHKQFDNVDKKYELRQGKLIQI